MKTSTLVNKLAGLLAVVLCMFVSVTATAQVNIVKAEYFIDADPGFGLAIDIPVAAAANIADKTIAIPLTGVTDGFHNLFLRTKDANGFWSITNKSAFFKTTATGASLAKVVKVEYFIDADPGFSQAINIPVTDSNNIADNTISIPLTSVTEGFHNLFLRSLDANGNWSVTNKVAFFKTNAATGTLPDVVKVEYFIDTDPGFGLATNIPVAAGTNIADISFTIPLSTVTEGFHNLFLRSLDANGKWSVTNKVAFFKTNATTGTLPDVVQVEYFIDTDPGFGLATDIPVTTGTNIADNSFTIPLTTVVEGFHNLFLRSKDVNGKWSVTNKVAFFKTTTATGSLPDVVQVEYFIDTDPGFGLANNIPVTAASNIADNSFTIPLTTVSEGFHNLFLRSKDVNGKWSVTNKTAFFKTAASALPNIVKAEYFIDTDPGFGLGTAISVSPSTNILNQAVPIDISTVSIGHHTFYLRSLDVNGKWSITNLDTFYIPFIVQPFVTLDTVTSNLCAGNNVNIPFTVNTTFGSTNVYTAQLSDASGSFTSPVNIGTLVGFDSGIVHATIPANTPAGIAYRIRIVASSPVNTSNISLNAITIGRVPELPYSISGAATTCPGIQNYSASATEASATYTWALTGGGTLTPTGSTASINWTTPGTDTITLTASNGCGNGTTKQLIVNVFATAPTIIPSITVVNRTLNATAAGIAQGVTGYQWFKDGVPMGGQTNQSYTVPNADSASYTVAYTNTCGTGPQSAPQLITIAKTDQTITFDAVSPKVFGDAAFIVNATATSTLPVVYTILSGPATITGNTITITGAGTIVVEATQAGNNIFNPATANISIIVSKAAATIVLSNLIHTYTGTGKAAIATTNPLGLNNAITYNGVNTLPVNAGSYTTVATITSLNYSGDTTDLLVINKADQTITLPAIPDKSFNSPAFTVNATATSGLPVTLSVVTVPPTGVASVTGNTITLLGAGGIVTVTANQAGNTNYNPATAVSTSFNVTPPLANDMQVVALVSPAGGCGLGSTANITVKLKNLGTAAASGFTVSYKIDNGTAVDETFTGTIAAGQEQNHTFTTPAGFPVFNTIYQVKTYVTLTGDQRTSNDTLVTPVVRFAQAVTGVSADTTICSGTTATLRAFGGGTYNWTGGPSTAVNLVAPLTNTTYQVAVTDINGCATTNYSVTVTVNSNPVANAGNDTSILRGSSATLTATGGIKYLWSTGDTTAVIAVSPVTTTSFIVTAGNAAKCTAKDTVKVTVNFSALNVTPSVIDFGSVVVDSSVTTNITITNNGTLTETLNSLAGLIAPFTTTLTTPQTIAPGATLILPVKFSPTATLFYQNVFAMNTSVGTFSISLKGKGVVPAAAWSITPAQYNYGNVIVGSFVNKDFIITNTGNVSIKISTVSSSSPRFVGTVNGITTVPVGGSVTLAVKFNPTAITSYTGSITVRTLNANLGFLKPILAGTGYVPGTPPEIIFVGNAPFNDTSGVTPPVGPPGNYTYSIIYKHPGGIAPMAGFPKVAIDKNADGDYADNGEGVFSMVKVDSGTNWSQGVLYTFITSLPLGDFYGYQFFATDSLGNEAIITNYKKGPLVTRETLDLHIYANDIVFSNSNPAVNQDFQVSATIHNNSPYPAANVEVRFYYKDSIYLFNDTIPFIDVHSQVTLIRTLNFSPDGFYPIKVWIDSSRVLGELNYLNNYASRPVIVGNFTIPGTIDLTSTATPDGCSKGKVIYSGHASYRGLNLTGTPPVEGATVTITIPGYGTGRVIETNTDVNGNWYVYDNPCAQDPNPEDCVGYLCGVVYDYTVEVTDYTITSPVFSGSVVRPCVNCNPDGIMQNSGSIGCVLPNEPFNYSINIVNFSYDFSGRKLCAPTVYNDTISVYENGALEYTYTLDSLAKCDAITFNSAFSGLPVGTHSLSFTHSYYTANGTRVEVSNNNTLIITPSRFDLHLEGITKTGRKSFVFEDVNVSECGAIPGGFHKIYLYDSLIGYTERVLLDSFLIPSIGSSLPSNRIALSYNNPNWAVGKHFLTIYTDATFLLTEMREDNNVLKAVFIVEELKPDILTKGITFSSSTVTPGSLINFAATFKNIGDGNIDVPFKVSFRANGVFVGSAISIPSLLAGETIEIISSPFTIPTNPCPIQVIAYADIDNVIAEIKETNNTDTAIFGINIKAGRTCDDNSGDETIGAGFFNDDDPFATISCVAYVAPKGRLTYFATTVKNTGTRDASNIKVQFTHAGVVIGSDVIPVLKAGAKTESGFFYTFDTVGRFIISAFADYTRELCEISELDNIGLIHVDTKNTSPDLQILSQHIAPSNLNPDPGQTITIVSSILNVGDAVSTPCKVRFWVDDVQLGADVPIDSIFPGQDTTVMATLTYSSNIVGPKIIKVKADVNDAVLEKREGNNEATRSIIVGGAPDFAHSLHEAITIGPGPLHVGDSVTICNYLRNYGGDGGVAWLRFSYRDLNGDLHIIDSVLFNLEPNDSAQVCLRWQIPAIAGMIITEILHSFPPEFNELNNIDSLLFTATLPVTLVSFTGVKNRSDVMLQWKTTSEINLLQYEIERSRDGRRFEKIEEVAANNSAGNHAYNSRDINPWATNGNNIFYRLKMIDIDGNYRYSNVVNLTNKLFATFNVSPNPVRDMLNIQLQASVKGMHVVKVFDAAGKLYLFNQFDLQEGNQVIRINANKLAQGMYLMVVVYPDGKMEELKFVKE